MGSGVTGDQNVLQYQIIFAALKPPAPKGILGILLNLLKEKLFQKFPS
jgi:hypothetical protein